jgi:hypothetical protein
MNINKSNTLRGVIGRFIADMNKRTYDNWRLEHITTFYPGSKIVGMTGEPLATYAHSAICAAVPSVQRSWMMPIILPPITV